MYLYRVASTRIESLQGDPWLSCLHVDRLTGVVPLVDDDVLVLLRGDVWLPRYVEAAGDWGNILDDRRRRTLRSVNSSDSFRKCRFAFAFAIVILNGLWYEYDWTPVFTPNSNIHQSGAEEVGRGYENMSWIMSMWMQISIAIFWASLRNNSTGCAGISPVLAKMVGWSMGKHVMKWR